MSHAFGEPVEEHDEPAAPAAEPAAAEVVPAGEDKRDDERPGEELDLLERTKRAGDPYFQGEGYTKAD